MTTAHMSPPTIDGELLEAWIDRGGTVALLEALAVILADKAGHLRSNWQDEAMAREYDKASRIVDGATAKILKLGVF